nr:SprT family zinc-dependent metalloprotease [Amylibacter sp.]
MNFGFPCEVVRSKRKKSASIEIIDSHVRVTVPFDLSESRIEALVKKRSSIIRQKLETNTKIIRPKPKEYVNGETFTYLGRNYRLKRLRSGAEGAKLIKGYLTVPELGKASDDPVRASLEHWYRTRAAEKLNQKTKRYSSILGVSPKAVEITEYKARWGSCSSDGIVSYNWRIIIAPNKIVDYIVVHELCHLLEPNHGPKYWKHVESVVPDYREHKAWLKNHGQTLNI